MRNNPSESCSKRLLNGQVSFLEAGRGPALVLVHGIGGYSASWEPQLSQFRSSFRLIAWDAPGYGSSDPLKTDAPRARDYAEVLADLLDDLGIARAYLVGHSLGAIFLAALCRQRPSLAQSIVFLHPVAGSGMVPPQERETLRRARVADLSRLGSRGFAQLRGQAILGSVTPKARRDSAIDVMARVPESGYLAAWEAMCAANIFDDLEAICCPTLILTGSDDPVSPEATCRAICDRVSGATFKSTPGLGHYGSLEAPEIINQTISAFLRDAVV